MKAFLRRGSWRYVVVAVLSLALVTTTAFAFVHHSQAAQTPPASRIMKIPGQSLPTIKPSVSADLGTLPTLTASAAAKLSAQPSMEPPSPLTKAQQQAYDSKVAHRQLALPMGSLSPAPEAAPSAAQIAQSAAVSPEFDASGYTALPPVTHSFVGQNSTHSGASPPPDMALASNPSYIMEGNNNVLTVYNFSGKVVYGPIYTVNFFSPILCSACQLADPQVFWDATRLHWVFTQVMYDELDATTLYSATIDIAISKSQTPDIDQPSDWWFREVPAMFNYPTGTQDAVACFYDTMGNDYWGLWIDCTAYNAYATTQWVGNFVLGIDKSALYADQPAHVVRYVNIPRDSSGDPAFRLSSVNQDATPDAEFLVATNVGFGGPHSDLVTCAFTDTHLLQTSGIPSLSCVDQTMPVSYSDATLAQQPGLGPSLDPGSGTKQLSYIGGMIYLSMVTATGVPNDGIWWAIIQPQLSPLNPANPASQTVKGSIVQDNAIWDSSAPTTDLFDPSFIGTSQGDADLVYNSSSTTRYPSIVYTARRATDAHNSMGGLTATAAFIKQGTAETTFMTWGDYSSCSLDTNQTSRGLVWCGGEYGGPLTPTNGWDTWIYAIQS